MARPPREARRGLLLVHRALCHLPDAQLHVASARRPLQLAHELGHGVHAALARPQGIFHFTTPLTLAETASIFGETIVLERLLEARSDADARLSATTGALDGAVAAVFQAGRHEPLRGRDPR